MKQLIKQQEYLEKIIHDLKIPADAQVCALEFLLKTTSEKFSSDEVDLIKLTLNSCNYMKKLIDTFCDVYKLNCSKLHLNYERFNFIDLLNSVLDEYKILLKYNKLELEPIFADREMINADKTQLKCVIENILSNSINTAFADTKIQIKIYKYKKELCFEVKNNSRYIEANVLKEIFEKQKSYFSLYNRPAVGLGLYLSKEIIKAHYGRMIARSYPENVNIFGFYIPLE